MFVAAWLSFVTGAKSVTPLPGEFESARRWAEDAFARDPAGRGTCGVSFRYHDVPSLEFLKTWQHDARQTDADATRAVREIVHRDPATGLEVRIELTVFKDWPAVEWVAHFRNTTNVPTPIIEGIAAMDGVLPVTSPDATTTLHWARGGVASFDDFAPQETLMRAKATLHLQPGGGRSSSQVMPYFNLEGAGNGVVAAIGWTGEWAADFNCDPKGQVTFKAGLARTRLFLEPGETIRTPRMMLVFYSGDRWRGQNLLRQFILAHHRPQLGGKPMVAPVTCGNWGATSAEVHLDNIARIIEHRLPIDYYWIDAEWYGKGGWPDNVGNWTVKADLYPQGFSPLSEALRKSGRDLMLWFEPERVHKGTQWHREHPEWLLGPRGDDYLFNLGDAAARNHLTEFMTAMITSSGLGCYRQDFNFEPLPYWRAADPPGREGITEIRYIEGLYAYWDALLARFPNLMIDNCASGGRRLDFEATSRATPYWRSDGPRDPIAHQCHSQGLLAWLPLSATSQDRAGDDYEFRSSMCSSLCLNWWVAGDVPARKIPATFPFDWARKTLEQYLSYRDDYYGDYYPLTRYSPSPDVWMAYQLDRPEQGRGLVVVLRRPDSPYQSARFALRGVEPGGRYRVTALDGGAVTERTGLELITTGIDVVVGTRPGSALFVYQRQ